MRACLGTPGNRCGRLIPASQRRCPSCKYRHQAQRDARRGTPAERGYDAEYIRNRRIVLATGDPCHWCGAPAQTADHLLPLSRGGTSDLDNLVPSCKPCNYGRGNRMARR